MPLQHSQFYPELVLQSTVIPMFLLALGLPNQTDAKISSWSIILMDVPFPRKGQHLLSVYKAKSPFSIPSTAHQVPGFGFYSFKFHALQCLRITEQDKKRAKRKSTGCHWVSELSIKITIKPMTVKNESDPSAWWWDAPILLKNPWSLNLCCRFIPCSMWLN